MYTLEWALKAVKQLARLPEKEQERVYDGAQALADWPDVRNVKALAGRGDYRLRVGRYRVIFTVHKAGMRVIRIEEVKKRDERTY